MAKKQIPLARFIQYAVYFSGGILLVVTAFFRFWRLGSLPPALYSGEAKVGLEALGLAQHGWLPGLTAANGYAPLWIWLQAIPVKLLGHTELALRLMPALLGLAAVFMAWIWAKDWFGARIGWLAAFLMAVSPWAVTMSRNAMPTALVMLLVPLTLWAGTWAYHHKSAKRWAVLALVLVADLGAGPIGWLLAVTTVTLGAIKLGQQHKLMQLDQPRVIGLGILGLGVATFAYLTAISSKDLMQLPSANGLAVKFATMADTAGRTLLMFNLHGDESFRHNFAGEPLLNAFVGLMFVAGLLVTISRLHDYRYRVLLSLFAVFSLPVLLSAAGSPNAARAIALLPIIMVMAAIGISYMLELWYMTFPINSAARSLGQAVIILLLVLTLFQGYTQYFKAWAQSIETYQAYNEGAVAAAKAIKGAANVGAIYAVMAPEELPVAAYLAAGTNYTVLRSDQIAGLPLASGPRQFVITSAMREEASKSLGLKFPGGKLKPHLSAFSQNELYYTYETGK